MKEFARNFWPLSILPFPTEQAETFARNPSPLTLRPATTKPRQENFDLTADSLRRSFHGWLDAVEPAPVLNTENQGNKATLRFYQRRPVTSTDIIRVNRATVRESDSHRHWPREIVEKFLAAPVITRQ